MKQEQIEQIKSEMLKIVKNVNKRTKEGFITTDEQLVNDLCFTVLINIKN